MAYRKISPGLGIGLTPAPKSKPPKRKRRLRKAVLITPADQPRLEVLVPYL